ncbi:MAG: hypothetical protein JWM94_72 [Sphingomonas bacterium]|nr:hypothetical protein [Sphingomonas bacterium]
MWEWIKEQWDRLTSTDNKGTANVNTNDAVTKLTKDPAFGSMQNTVSGTPTSSASGTSKPSSSDPGEGHIHHHD